MEALNLVRQYVQHFAIKGRDLPTYTCLLSGLFQPRDFAPADASASTLQLDQTNLQRISILSLKPECNRVNDARAWRSRLTFEKGDLPTGFFAVRVKRGLAGRLRSAGLYKRGLLRMVFQAFSAASL